MAVKVSLLFVTQHFHPEVSACASRISDFARYLKDMGTDVAVVSPFPTLPLGKFGRALKVRKRKRFQGVEVVNLWSWQPLGDNPHLLSRLSYYLSFCLHAALWFALRHPKRGIVITSTPPLSTAVVGLLAKKLFGLPWIVDYRDHWLKAALDLGLVKRRTLLAKLGKYVETKMITEADKVFVVHESMIETLSRAYNVQNRDAMVLVPNGVDTSLFRPEGGLKKQRILYAGNVGFAHDLKNFVVAMPSIVSKHNIRLTIVGTGDARGELESFIRFKGLSEYVEFLPPVEREKLPHLMSESILGIDSVRDLDSLGCAIPTKFYEYMACSIPFVGCGGEAMRELADKSGAGIVVGNDPDDIASTIISLLDQPERAVAMGERGRRFVSQNFENRALVALMFKQILNLTSKKSSGRPYQPLIGEAEEEAS